MSAKPPETILRLVERFGRDRRVFLSGDYKEEQLRAEFLNPFFEALGWDVYNKQGLSETYKPVIHEESIKVAGASKAPDYTFRIGGRRVFFTEAKKPSVKVAEDIAPAFQLRRYAWTAKLPVSILTDFEEFAVYDCRIRPVKTDKAAVGRTMLLSFKDYLTRWGELTGLFSPEAIQKGALERYVESTKVKKGTAAVDDAFLLEISGWRELLARNIALRNPRLSTRELNFSVQRTIDRLIFLRICEDRGIESYAYLQSLLNGTNIYARLKKHFYDADDRYNSGLFHFARRGHDRNPPGISDRVPSRTVRVEPPDELTPDLVIDDKPLKDIISGLYYPDSPYEFSVMPAEVLGQVYEQFLGKVIRLTAGHQAKVEDKPEVRKAGGVYYTPAYIVDYIVKNTVGKLLEGSSPQPSPRRGEGKDSLSLERERARVRVTPNKSLTPEQASRLRILDPACGSGSFLLGAYQYLLDWHLDYYQKERGRGSGARGQGPTYKDASGNLRLTTAERKRILLNNIYGVDIDSQAVEVTKLSLLLKVLEGENQETISSQLKLYHERALPDLGSNTKCGNSLIGPDFYHGEQQTMFADEEERLRINVFDWSAAFPDIMKPGGFDAVIGNPPYVEFKRLEADIKAILTSQRFQTVTGKYDLYIPFMEKGISLLRPDGLLGFIVPTMFAKRDYGRALRDFIMRMATPEHIVDFGDFQVFRGATNYVGIFTFRRRVSDRPCTCRVSRRGRGADALELQRDLLVDGASESLLQFQTPRASLGRDPWMLASSASSSVLDRLNRKPRIAKLGEVTEAIWEGIASGKDEVFYLTKSSCRRLRLERGITLPLLRGRDVKRWHVSAEEDYCVVYPYDLSTGAVLPEKVIRQKYPRAYSYLSEKRDLLKGRGYFERSGKLWFELWCPRDPTMFAREKLVVPEIAQRNAFALDACGTAFNTKVYGLVKHADADEDYRYFLGLLNSRLLDFLYKLVAPHKAGGYFAYKTQYLRELPFRTIALTDHADKAKHDKMVSLVERMLELHKQLPKVKTPHEQESIQRQISATDKHIDALVYELYGLTESEIATVEGRAK